MQVDLSPEASQFLSAVVASGKYRDENDALTEAVELLRRRDELKSLLEVGEKELDANLGVPAEVAFERLEKKAAELDRQAGPQSQK
jgi:Arc/MetJ-type ribon-helix-helix transcriptional regulator